VSFAHAHTYLYVSTETRSDEEIRAITRALSQFVYNQKIECYGATRCEKSGLDLFLSIVYSAFNISRTNPPIARFPHVESDSGFPCALPGPSQS
jgi:hypothetical protein